MTGVRLSFSLLSVRVEELRRVPGRLSQCHRCQGYGHGASFCAVAPACVKCAGPHLTRDCTKKIEQPPKCVNCGGAHPANYRSCTKSPNAASYAKVATAAQVRPLTGPQKPSYTPSPSHPVQSVSDAGNGEDVKREMHSKALAPLEASLPKLAEALPLLLQLMSIFERK